MKKIVYLCILLVTYSCSKDDILLAKKPEAALLVFPKDKQECNEGVPVPNTNKTSVTFIWENDMNATSYKVVLKDLSSQIESEFITDSNELTANLKKATPYSWSVISYNAVDLETVQSEVWKFYNAGDVITSHAPFPADAVYPGISKIYQDIITVRLEWDGLDIDNDIISYDVYFDTVKPPLVHLGNTSENIMNTDVSAGNIYYWRIITNDSDSNTSQSEIFEFKVE